MSSALKTVFYLDHASLSQNAEFTGLAQDLAPLRQIASQASFNDYCKAACRLWLSHFPEKRGSTSPLFSDLSQRISAGGIDREVIPTSWGGVVISHYQPPQIEKYLVIKAGNYLALETHTVKSEQIEVCEGAGLLLSRDKLQATLSVCELKPGDSFSFEPGIEHCIIGTEDLLVFERSTEPKGMDQDLIFIYTPEY